MHIIRPLSAACGGLSAIDAVSSNLDAGEVDAGDAFTDFRSGMFGELGRIHLHAVLGDLAADLPDGAAGRVAGGGHGDSRLGAADAMAEELGKVAAGHHHV